MTRRNPNLGASYWGHVSFYRFHCSATSIGVRCRACPSTMTKSPSSCLFCAIAPSRIVAENEFAYAIRDGYPVTALHTLVIPKRHAPDYFDLSQVEIACCNSLIFNVREAIQSQDRQVEGFNIGINCGEVAGQTIFHCHIHLIPRRRGDVEAPSGGVRHLIPGKGSY